MSNVLPYDPKLKEAMSEVAAILKKHDIAGFVVLTSPTHSEYRFQFDPSWSGLKWESQELGAVRINIREAELGPEKAVAMADATVHLIVSMENLCGLGFQQASALKNEIGKYFEIIETGGEITGHLPH